MLKLILQAAYIGVTGVVLILLCVSSFQSTWRTADVKVNTTNTTEKGEIKFKLIPTQRCEKALKNAIEKPESVKKAAKGAKEKAKDIEICMGETWKTMKGYEQAALVFMVIAFLLSLACLIWALFTLCACCCKSILAIPLAVLPLAGALAVIIAIGVYAGKSTKPEDFKESAENAWDSRMVEGIYLAGGAMGGMIILAVLAFVIICTGSLNPLD